MFCLPSDEPGTYLPTQFNVFLVNIFRDWSFIFNIGRGSKMFQFLYNMAKNHWKPVWKQWYVSIIYTNYYTQVVSMY